MENSSLIQILKTFTSKEIKEFESFTASPFFNKNKRVTELFELLKKEYPKFKSEKIIKEDLYCIIFPGEKYHDENMKTIIYLLTRLAEKFMAYEKFQSDSFDERNYLLSSLDKRKLDNIFMKYEKQTSEKINNISGIELDSLYKKIDFEKIRGIFYSERNIEQTMYQTDIKTGNLIITSFFIEMFRLTNLFARIKYLGFDLDHDFATDLMDKVDMNSFLTSMEKYSFENLPVVEVYYFLHKTLNDNDSDEHYWNFKKSFDKNREMIGKSEQYIISTLMVNCLYYKHLKDSAKYDREFFEAFKILLSLYDYSGDKYLRFVIYTNILRLAVQFKEFDWTENFIKEYSIRLMPEQKENMMYYSNAFLSFAKSDFEKTLKYASKINFDTFQMKYYLRDLQLSSFYELSQFDAALDMIDAYKHFIKKEKNYSDSLKQGYLDFINSLYSLIKIRLGEGKSDIKLLRQKVTSSNSMKKQWLLDKIEELEKKFVKSTFFEYKTFSNKNKILEKYCFVLKTEINGIQCEMQLDSGCPFTFLTDTFIKKNCISKGKINSYKKFDKATYDGHHSHIKNVNISIQGLGEINFPKCYVEVLKTAKKKKNLKEVSDSGLPFAGYLGYDFLAGKLVEINYKNNMIIFYSSMKEFQKKNTRFLFSPLLIKKNAILFPVKICNTTDGYTLFDTGSSMYTIILKNSVFRKITSKHINFLNYEDIVRPDFVVRLYWIMKKLDLVFTKIFKIKESIKVYTSSKKHDIYSFSHLPEMIGIIGNVFFDNKRVVLDLKNSQYAILR